MPAVDPAILVNAIIDAIQECGESAILMSPVRAHPRQFAVSGPSGEMLLSVYAWTLTPGGRPQLPHEYRIQMTAVRSPLELNSDGATVLLGYEPDLKMLAGFDLARHRRFTTGSPSVQIDIRKIQEALQNGLAFDRKENSEIAIGVRPDQFMNYVRNASDLHRLGRDQKTQEMLVRATSPATALIRPGDLESLTTERRRIVQTISRLSRRSNFEQQVKLAYGYRCAVTRMQLKLIDSAHILPVKAPGSVDDVRNGIALTPTYHRAFDNGLIYLDPSYRMRLNAERASHLAHLDLDGGLESLKDSLGRVHLPPDPRQWPDVKFIRKANEYRRIRAS